MAVLLQLAAAATVAASPVVASAAPLRAGAALPGRGTSAMTAPVRAATPAKQPSQLVGFPILALLGLIGTVSIVVVLASGNGRSPG